MNTATATQELVGEYMVTSGEKSGHPEPRDRVYGTTVRFTEDTVAVVDAKKQELYMATYEIDTDSTPWKIIMTATQAPNSGDVAQGLIEKQGDRIRLIYALPGAEPPTGFRTEAGQHMFEMHSSAV